MALWKEIHRKKQRDPEKMTVIVRIMCLGLGFGTDDDAIQSSEYDKCNQYYESILEGI